MKRDAFGVSKAYYEFHPNTRVNARMNAAKEQTKAEGHTNAGAAYESWSKKVQGKRRSPWSETVGDAKGSDEGFAYWAHKLQGGKDDFGRPIAAPKKIRKPRKLGGPGSSYRKQQKARSIGSAPTPVAKDAFGVERVSKHG